MIQNLFPFFYYLTAYCLRKLGCFYFHDSSWSLSGKDWNIETVPKFLASSSYFKIQQLFSFLDANICDKKVHKWKDILWNLSVASNQKLTVLQIISLEFR